MNPSELSTRAQALGASTLYEASLRDCALDPAIRTIWKGATIAAPAYPVQCAPGDNLAIHIALERVPRGAVLVIDTQDFIAGYWGEVLTVAAQAAGVVGLVTNGGVRDVAAMTQRGFPVFTRGISVRGTLKASAPCVGKPIRVGGIAIHAGDWIVADDDGVIAIPADAFEDTLRAAEARAAKEAEFMRQLANGASTMTLLGLSDKRPLA